MPGLIGRTGPRRCAAHGLIGPHHAPGHVPLGFLQPHAGAAHEIQRADIECGRHAHLRPAGDERLREERAGVTVVERPVDVGGSDRDQPRGAHQAGGFRDDAHRHGRALAIPAGRDGRLVLGQRRHRPVMSWSSTASIGSHGSAGSRRCPVRSPRCVQRSVECCNALSRRLEHGCDTPPDFS